MACNIHMAHQEALPVLCPRLGRAGFGDARDRRSPDLGLPSAMPWTWPARTLAALLAIFPVVEGARGPRPRMVGQVLEPVGLADPRAFSGHTGISTCPLEPSDVLFIAIVIWLAIEIINGGGRRSPQSVRFARTSPAPHGSGGRDFPPSAQPAPSAREE